MARTYRTETFSAEYVREALHYDPETGLFTWRHRSDRERNWNSRWAGKPAGAFSNGYIYIQIDGRSGFSAGRLAWLYMTGEWPPIEVDHRNLNRADNRWENLRLADVFQNNQNKVAQSNNLIGVRGISAHPTAGFRVRLTVRKVHYDLGYFPTLEEAMEARKRLEEEHHGDFAPKK